MRPASGLRVSGAAALAAASIAAIAGAALTLGSCATSFRVGASADPLSILDPGAIAYVRLSGAAAGSFAPSLLPPAQAASLRPLLARTRSIAVGLAPLREGEEGLLPPFGAALVGDYSFGKAALLLGDGGGWRREGNVFVDARTGLMASLPGPDLVVAGTVDLQPLLARARGPGASPLPVGLEALSAREILIVAPEPFGGLARAIMGESMEVPARSLVIAATPGDASTEAGESGYLASVVFCMADAEAARIYRPSLRLAWYAIARGLLGDGAEAALAASFSLEGNLFVAKEVVLSREGLASALSALSGTPSRRGRSARIPRSRRREHPPLPSPARRAAS